VEHFVQASLLLGRALDVPLEVELSRLVLKHLRRHAIFQLIWIAFSLKLFSQIQFGADKNTGTVLGGSFHLCDPFVAGIFQRFAIDQTEADKETVSVGEGDGAQSAKIIVTGGIPNLKLHLSSLVVLGSVVGIKNRRLVKGGEFLLSPSHDYRSFSNGGIADEDQLHVVFLVLINHWFVYFSHFGCLFS